MSAGGSKMRIRGHRFTAFLPTLSDDRAVAFARVRLDKKFLVNSTVALYVFRKAMQSPQTAKWFSNAVRSRAFKPADSFRCGSLYSDPAVASRHFASRRASYGDLPGSR
jgi:hypothetical protein